MGKYDSFVEFDRRAQRLRPVLNDDTARELQNIFITTKPQNLADMPEPFQTWFKNPRRIPKANLRIMGNEANGDPVYIELDDDRIAAITGSQQIGSAPK
jgi:hypothetical protein